MSDAYTVVYRSGIRIIQTQGRDHHVFNFNWVAWSKRTAWKTVTIIQSFNFCWPQITQKDFRSEAVHFTNFSILWFRNCLDNKGSICDVDPNYTSTYTLFMVFAYGRSYFERDKMMFSPLCTLIRYKKVTRSTLKWLKRAWSRDNSDRGSIQISTTVTTLEQIPLP